MTVTYHAKDRIHVRMGLHKSCSEKVAKRALEIGLRHEDVSGSLKRYLDKIYLEHMNANNQRIWNNQIFLFHKNNVDENILVTVLTLPSQYHKTVNKIRNKVSIQKGEINA